MNQVSDDKPSSQWSYRPDLSKQIAPYFNWPLNINKVLRYYTGSWSLFDVRIYVLGFSILTWVYFSPSLDRCKEFSTDWIAQIWLRHFIVILIVAGGLHLYFYTFNKQGNTEKYDHRELTGKSKRFHFNHQLWDNMFWVLTGTVGFLTFYEVLMMWAYANGIGSTITISESPFWFIFLLFLTPSWTGFHFYWQHRVFHVPVFYKLGHDWHHKNINVGPWSGAAVHPIENWVWFSAVLVLLLFPSHPIHAIFLMQLQVITAITTHVGYEHLLVGKNIKFRLGDFFHQLHHKHFECNYGTIATPWDQWFKTYHDGTLEGDKWVKNRRKQLNKSKY